MIELFTNFWFLLFAMIVITSVTGTIAHVWQKVRRAEQEAALKQDMLQRGLSVEDIERVLRARTSQRETYPTENSDDGMLEEFAGLLGACQASPSAIEELLAMVQTADSATKQAIVRAVEGMRDGSEEGISEEEIRAVVRALVRPAGQPAESATSQNGSSPAIGAASRFSDAFRPSERPSV